MIQAVPDCIAPEEGLVSLRAITAGQRQKHGVKTNGMEQRTGRRYRSRKAGAPAGSFRQAALTPILTKIGAAPLPESRSVISHKCASVKWLDDSVVKTTKRAKKKPMHPDELGSKEDPESVLRIESKPWESFKEDILETAAEVNEGDEPGPDKLSFSDPGQIARILTQKRLELIRTVMLEEPESMRALARLVDRNPKEVNDDVHLLEEYGIITLKQDGRAKRPVVPYDRIEFAVTLELDESSGSDPSERLAVQ